MKRHVVTSWKEEHKARGPEIRISVVFLDSGDARD